MTLELIDFVTETEGVDLEDFPPEVQDRINGALGDLTGNEGGPGNEPVDPPQSIIVDADGDGDYESIQTAIEEEATSGDVIFVEPGEYESFAVGVEDLTLEGPNAGIDGDSGERGAEATITGGVFVDGNPSDVVIDGLAIERTIGEAEGVVQIGSTSNPGANDLTIRNNVITATSDGPQRLGTILIEHIDGEIQIEDNLLTQTGDGPGEGLVRGLVQAVQLENTKIVFDGNTVKTDIGVALSGFSGPVPKYTITSNEFVENGFGVLVFDSYDVDELQAFEQNSFTGAADTTYVDYRGDQLNLEQVRDDQDSFEPDAVIDEDNNLVPEDEEE